MNRRDSLILLNIGSAGMLVGAIDPLEGSLLILPASALMALGTYWAQAERRVLAYRVWVFVAILIGVAALWGMTMAGGLGGTSGHSLWWALLALPYLIGWSLGVWGPGSPRWMLWLGIAVSLWYIVIFAISMSRNTSLGFRWPLATLAVTGIVTAVGCISQLLRHADT